MGYMHLKFSNLQKFILKKSWLLPAAFATVFLVDLAYSFYRLTNLNGGGDSQWYGTMLYWSGTNPYTACLESSEWFMTTFPNYAHLLYIVMFPLTFFEWETAKIIWFLLSLCGFLLTLYFFVYKEKVWINKVLVPGILLLIGSTLTNALYQGQMSIIILTLVSLAWIFRNKSILLILFLSIIFTKYSFGLPILFGFFLAGYRKESIAAFGINMVCALIFSYQFNMGFLETLKLPFDVASRFTEFGHSDLISIFRTTNPGETIFGLNYFSILAAVIYLIYSYFCIVYKADKKAIVVSSILLSFSILFHLDYDYVVLLAAILISMSGTKLSKGNLILLVSVASYFWLYPIIPKLMRTFLHIDTGLLPVEWFGHTFGTIFIIFNTVLITTTAFRILLDKNLNSYSRTENIQS